MGRHLLKAVKAAGQYATWTGHRETPAACDSQCTHVMGYKEEEEDTYSRAAILEPVFLVWQMPNI